jgi:hypothetical protein
MLVKAAWWMLSLYVRLMVQLLWLMGIARILQVGLYAWRRAFLREYGLVKVLIAEIRLLRSRPPLLWALDLRGKALRAFFRRAVAVQRRKCPWSRACVYSRVQIVEMRLSRARRVLAAFC